MGTFSDGNHLLGRHQRSRKKKAANRAAIIERLLGFYALEFVKHSTVRWEVIRMKGPLSTLATKSQWRE